MKPGSDIGTAIAVLRFEPEELARKRDLKFDRAYDDLDYVKVARLNKNVSLVRHEGSPAPGTEIVLTSGLEPVGSELESILKELGLSDNDVTWKHPAVARPAVPPRRIASSTGAQVWVTTGLRPAERRMVLEALRRARGNRAQAARLLKVSYKTMLLKIMHAQRLPRPTRGSRKK